MTFFQEQLELRTEMFFNDKNVFTVFAGLQQAESSTIIPHLEWIISQLFWVRVSLENQLGQFLRDQRGEMTYAQFSKKVGLPPSTLHRLERGEQSITLRGLQQIMKRLKCGLVEIFPKG